MISVGLILWTMYVLGVGVTVAHQSHEGDDLVRALMWGVIWPVVIAVALLDTLYRIAVGLCRKAKS